MTKRTEVQTEKASEKNSGSEFLGIIEGMRPEKVMSVFAWLMNELKSSDEELYEETLQKFTE